MLSLKKKRIVEDSAMKIISFIGKTLVLLIVLLFALTAAISFFSAPEDEGFFGLKGYTVVSGSMEPTFSVGDFVFVQANGINNVNEGDVITFTRNGEIVTHRATELTETGITTKGDANNIQDQSQVTKDDYIGTLSWILPYFGYVVVAVQQPLVRIVLGLLLSLYFIWLFVLGLNKEKKAAV